MALLNFEQISFKYNSSGSPTIYRLNLEIKQGEAISILGSNSVGKTTFFKILSGRVNDNIGKLWGNFKVNDILVNTKSSHEYPLDRFFNFDVACMFGKGLENHSNNTVESLIRAIVSEYTEDKSIHKSLIAVILNTFELSHIYNRHLSSLSCGEKKRVIIASELATDPELILVDEFRNNLDTQGQMSFLSLLNALTKKNKTVILNETTPLNLQPFIKRVIVVGPQFTILRDDTLENILKDREFLIETGFLQDRRKEKRSISNDENLNYRDFIKLRQKFESDITNQSVNIQYEQLTELLAKHKTLHTETTKNKDIKTT